MRARPDEPTAVARFAARAPEDDPERVSVSVCDVACLSNQSGDSSETTVVTCANDGTVAMWRSQNVNNDAASATKEGRSMRGDLTVLGCHDGAVAVACSASRGVVSSGGLDGRVRFWKMDTRRSFARSRYVRTHAFRNSVLVLLLTRVVFVSEIASARCVNARRCARWRLLRMGIQL